MDPFILTINVGTRVESTETDTVDINVSVYKVTLNFSTYINDFSITPKFRESLSYQSFF